MRELFENYPLASIAVRSLVLMLMTCACAWIFRKRSASLVHRIWTLGFCGSLIIPFAILCCPSWALPVLPATPATPVPPSEPPVQSVVKFRAVATTLAGTPAPVQTAIPPIQSKSPSSPPISTKPRNASRWAWSTCGYIAWCLGATILLARIPLRRLALQRDLRKHPVVGKHGLAGLSRCR